MPVITLALHLPQLLLRLLLLVLPFPPFAPSQSSPPASRGPNASGRALSNRPSACPSFLPFRRQRAPRSRPPGESQPRTPTACLVPGHRSPRHAPITAKKHPAPPQEFFGKNSYCARGAPSAPSQCPCARRPSSAKSPTFPWPNPRCPRAEHRRACTLAARSSVVVRGRRS